MIKLSLLPASSHMYLIETKYKNKQCLVLISKFNSSLNVQQSEISCVDGISCTNLIIPELTVLFYFYN